MKVVVWLSWPRASGVSSPSRRWAGRVGTTEPKARALRNTRSGTITAVMSPPKRWSIRAGWPAPPAKAEKLGA